MNDWSLRLVHEGYAGVLLERAGRRIRFDPVAALAHDDIAVLTGADPFASERTVGFPTVVRAYGAGEVFTEIDGVRFEGVSYSPPAADSSRVRVAAALRQPGEAAAGLPEEFPPGPVAEGVAGTFFLVVVLGAHGSSVHVQEFVQVHRHETEGRQSRCLVHLLGLQEIADEGDTFVHFDASRYSSGGKVQSATYLLFDVSGRLHAKSFREEA